MFRFWVYVKRNVAAFQRSLIFLRNDPAQRWSSAFLSADGDITVIHICKWRERQFFFLNNCEVGDVVGFKKLW